MFTSLLHGIKWIGNALQSLLLLFIRLYWGYQFASSGFGKFLNLDQVTQFFQSIAIPYPYYNAIAVAGVELVCGALIFFGLLTRIASIPLIVVMGTAIYTANHNAVIALYTQFDPTLFFQDAAFLFLYASLLIFMFGPGKISLDYWLTEAHKNKEMP